MLLVGCPWRQCLVSSLILVLLVADTAAGEEAMSMEVYFSQAELALMAGYGEEPVSSVVVTGQVACELCLRPGSDLLTFELAGATVAVTCKIEGSTEKVNSAFATTDECGEFTIDLPSRLHATPSIGRACTVHVLQLPQEFACRRPVESYILWLSSEEDGVRTYTTGVIRLQHDGVPSDECVQVEDRGIDR